MRIVTLVLLGIAFSSAVDAGQQTTDRPAARVVERADVSGVLPWRLVQTTNQTGDRETTTETEHMPNTDGRMVPVRETVIEVIRAGRVVRTSSETFGVGTSGQRGLLETRESITESSPEGRVRATSTTSRSDLNGRLAIAERITEETSVTPDTRRTERTIHRTDLNGQLRPMERTEHAERQVGPQGVQATITESQTDVNSRWQVIEIRNRGVRTTGVTEEAEETILQRDLNGTLAERERSVSRLTRQNGREDLVIETFSDGGGYPFRSSISRTLTSRIRRTTSPGADGGRQIVEEVEERSPVAADEPLRLVRRIVETGRRTGAGQWETERQVFERDANNRLVLTSSETEETTGP